MVRSFSTEEIEQEKIDQIIDNIISGPSAGYAQGTDIVVLTSKEDHETFFGQWGTPDERQSYRNKWPNLENAPLIILMCADDHRYRERYSQPDKTGITDNTMPWWLIDTGMATLLGLLTAVDQELVATFTGVSSQSYLRTHYDIPEHITTIGALLVGYQKGKYRPSTSVSRGKRNRNEIVHYNRW